MRKRSNIKRILPILFIGMVFLISSAAEGQTKKYKARLSIDYNKVMDSNPFLSIAVKFKGENGYEPAKKLSLEVYQQVKEDSLVHIGEVVTNMKGDAFFNLKDHQQVAVDSLIENIYVVRLEKSEKFKDASKSVKYYDVNLIANSIEKDSVNHITAKLTDAMGNPIEGVKLKVMVQRLFAPLQVGESYYKTKDNGTILVPIEEPLPGINGDLTFEVVLDSKKYGTVSHIFEAPIGVPIVDLSTFNDRTMWSPPNKTPWYLWVFPNLIILGIWAVIMLLFGNLIKIYKS